VPLYYGANKKKGESKKLFDFFIQILYYLVYIIN